MHRIFFASTLAAAFAYCASLLVASEASIAIRWDFGSEETSALKSHGGVHRDQLGPRPPEFPDFDETNLSVRFDGSGSRFSFPDPGEESEFDFRNGDSITIEACLKVGEIAEGQNVYVIGKGRTNNDGYTRDNQNWALRLRKLDGKVHISFLFATKKNPKSNSDAHWHRWTSNEGLTPASGWHWIAVSYKFGESMSVGGWIDGASCSGKWDMGGATNEEPVVDNDSIWIGSSMGGSAANSFRGWLDFIGVSRRPYSDQEMHRRFSRIPRKPTLEVPPESRYIPGKVVVSFDASLDSCKEWPIDEDSDPEFRQAKTPGVPDWIADQFLFHRLPFFYDSWGIRDSWKKTVLVRASARVEFPKGKSHLLVRSRGLSRLWIDGKIVARTKAMGGSTDGHQPVDPLPLPPAPGMRIVAYGVHEVIEEIAFDQATEAEVVFETLVGGPTYRAEPGETMIAIRQEGHDFFELLHPRRGSSRRSDMIMSDENMIRLLAETEASLGQFDREFRRSLAQSQDGFWLKRHEIAAQWVKGLANQTLSKFQKDSHDPVDRFLISKIENAKTKSTFRKEEMPSETGSVDFQREILPILSKNCFRCHGEGDEGGLKLDSRESFLKGGDSGEPALVPGDPHAGQFMARLVSEDEGERMPPSKPLTKNEIETLRKWVSSGGMWSEEINPSAMAISASIDDPSFLRRVYLDLVGVSPSEDEFREFFKNSEGNRRTKLIDQLLEDPRYADHWVSYWQDVLGENPNLLKPSLNNTGPFRWFLYESLTDNKPVDRMVTELVMLRGSEREGGSAGFGMAAENDAPLASRSIVLASAFMGINLQCARCHDSPYHETTQRDLFSLAAMISRGNVTVPKTSTVSPGFFEKNAGRESLIRVTLKPGEPVEPTWPFAWLSPANMSVAALVRDPKDSREVLAAHMTAPWNDRFAKVIANRVWKRLIGTGLVEPVDDWESTTASHPELLEWLAIELVSSGYDMKHLIRVIMNSAVYQREAKSNSRASEAKHRFFASPDRRRLTAEQVVDSMVIASNRPLDAEELSFDPEAKRPAKTMITLGVPHRAWMFATLSNERDRPSLAFPRATAVIDVMEAFGWTGSRQGAVNERDTEPNVLQPGVIANGVFTSWIVSASANSEIAEIAIAAKAPEEIVESIYIRFLSRMPTDDELKTIAPILQNGFSSRIVPDGHVKQPKFQPMLERVSWSNHLHPRANSIKIELEQQAREGDPPDPRLEPEWRERYEDFVWSVLNSPEFIWIP